jgi:hypothetical protein
VPETLAKGAPGFRGLDEVVTGKDERLLTTGTELRLAALDRTELLTDDTGLRLALDTGVKLATELLVRDRLLPDEALAPDLPVQADSASAAQSPKAPTPTKRLAGKDCTAQNSKFFKNGINAPIAARHR